MNNQSVTIINKSSKLKIKISLNSPEDASIPDEKEYIELNPQSSNKVSYSSSTANLFVKNKDDEMLWQGIVPTKTKNSIDIYPEEKKIMFSGVEIPGDYKNITEISTEGNKNSKNFYIYIILIIIILVLLGWFFNPFKKEK